MIEFYPEIRSFHITVAILSGALFAIRGAAVLAGAAWARNAPARYLSYAIDTALLTSALMLVSVLPGAVFANHWLSVKLGLVVAYIALGVFALRRARTPRGRIASYVAALVVFALVVGVARTHHPLGWLTRLGG